MYNKDQLETILYVFEGYMQGNDDEKLVQEMELICERTLILLKENVFHILIILKKVILRLTLLEF